MCCITATKDKKNEERIGLLTKNTVYIDSRGLGTAIMGAEIGFGRFSTVIPNCPSRARILVLGKVALERKILPIYRIPSGDVSVTFKAKRNCTNDVFSDLDSRNVEKIKFAI
jgi:hypothetical protein